LAFFFQNYQESVTCHSVTVVFSLFLSIFANELKMEYNYERAFEEICE